MKRASRKLVYLTWTLALAVLGALLWLSFQEPHGQTRRLPDGSTVELAKVTYGREHRYVAGHLWQRLQEQALPAGLAPSDGQRSTLVDQPVLWLRWNEPQGSSEAPFFSRYGVSIDEHACRLVNGETPYVWSARSLSAFSDSRSPSSRYGDLSPVTLDVYPRRSGHFQFGVANSVEGQAPPPATYDITVPPGGPFPEWSANKAPVSARSGSMEFTLASLVYPPPQWPTAGTACATFRYREQGRPTTNWRPDEITVLDATGNTLKGLLYPAPHTELVGFNGLCWREPAWKLRVHFVRRRPAEAPARFLWQFPRVTAPARNQTQFTPQPPSGPLGLQLVKVLGGGTITHPDGGVSTYGDPMVVVKVGKVDPRFSLALTRVTNEEGRDLPLPEERYFRLDRNMPECQLSFPYPPGTKQLNLTLGLYETHTAEFLVKP